MAELKRTYIIPLRKQFKKVPEYKRTKRAVSTVRAFLARHMKGEVKLGRHLNLFLWKQGIRNPPHHVKVDAIKDEKNVVKVELAGFTYEETKKTPETKGEVKEALNLLKGNQQKEEEKKEIPVEKKEEKEEKAEKKEESGKLKEIKETKEKEEKPKKQGRKKTAHD